MTLVLRLPKYRSDCLGRGCSVGSEHVSVDVGSHSYGGVSENAAHHLKRHALSQHQACGRVAELVDVPITQSRIPTEPLELPQ